jgi:hypothetical protein
MNTVNHLLSTVAVAVLAGAALLPQIFQAESPAAAAPAPAAVAVADVMPTVPGMADLFQGEKQRAGQQELPAQF